MKFLHFDFASRNFKWTYVHHLMDLQTSRKAYSLNYRYTVPIPVIDTPFLHTLYPAWDTCHSGLPRSRSHELAGEESGQSCPWRSKLWPRTLPVRIHELVCVMYGMTALQGWSDGGNRDDWMSVSLPACLVSTVKSSESKSQCWY